jgi:hypothetical protein
VPPLKRARLDGSDGESFGSPEASRQSARPRGKPTPKKKRSKVVISDESEDFDPVDDESEAEVPMEDDDDEYMSEPKSTSKRGAGTKGKATKGGKGKKKPEPKEITARDERKRPIQDSTEPAGAPAAKRARTKPAQKPGADVVVDIMGDTPAGTPPPREDATPAPAKKKLPPIKKNKPLTGASAASVPAASGAGTSTPSIPAKPVPLSPEESKLPPPVVGAGARKATLPFSTDVDLSNPTMYAQLFKSVGVVLPLHFDRINWRSGRRKHTFRLHSSRKRRGTTQRVEQDAGRGASEAH